MKFVVLLTCILLQSFNLVIFKDRYSFFDRYLELINPFLTKFNLTKGWSAIFGVLVPLLFAILILGLIFSHVTVLYFLFAVLVLMLCLDVRDVKNQLTDYFAAISSDNETRAQVEVEKFTHQQASPEKTGLIRLITSTLLLNSITNIFSVIFWFLLFGPFGAMLYYLVSSVENRASNPEFSLEDSLDLATYSKNILDWVPVRLVVLTYALIGHFAPVFNLWVEHLGDGISGNSKFLVDAGLTALDADKDPEYAQPEENHKALGLISRTLWTWMIVIAVLTLTSWIF